MVPFRVAFQVNATGIFGIVEKTMDVYFMMDILLTLNTAVVK